MSVRIIGLLDMDAFFAAVEERHNPQWTGRPIVVGSDPKNGHGRGVVSTANYAARTYGIHSAQPIRQAWHLAEAAAARGEPKTIFVPGNYRRYSAVSRAIMAILKRHSPTIQQRSVDEAYFDLSFSQSYEAAAMISQRIKTDIVQQQNLTASIGIGPNKLIAKIACDQNKPDALAVVRAEEAESFLEPLSLRVLPGIGPKTQQLLGAHGYSLVRDLKTLSRQELAALLGKYGDSLYNTLRGYGSTDLKSDGPAKSIGEQTTFFTDTLESAFLISKLFIIADNLIGYLHRDGLRSFRTVTIIVRLADFTTYSRAKTFKKSLTTSAELKKVALQLFLPFLDHRENPRHQLIRLLGLRLEKLG